MTMRKVRPLALGTAAAMAISGCLMSAPTFADDESPATPQLQEAPTTEITPDTTAPTMPEDGVVVPHEQGTDAPETTEDMVPTEAPVEDFDHLQEAGIQVVGIGITDDGDTILLTSADASDGPQATAALELLDDKYPGELIVENIGGVPQAASTGVPGGSGYYQFFSGTAVSKCSVGFAAWSPTGQPVMLTAGHCTKGATGKQALLARPSKQPAVTGVDTSTVDSLSSVPLGYAGFSQFGGPNGLSIESDPGQRNADKTPNQNNEQVKKATDIAVLERVGTDFVPIPAVTTWNKTEAKNENLTSSVIKVKNAGGKVNIGDTVTKSGRTTGLTSGNVRMFSDGWFTVQVGTQGTWYVRGFAANVTLRPGDSGGPVLQGNRAVGINSAYVANRPADDEYAFFASIDQGLSQLPAGYEVALDIDNPAVSVATGASVRPGALITVSVPANATGLTINGSPASLATGKATFTAPTTEGTKFTKTIVATNGKSKSKTVTVTYTVSKSAKVAPDPGWFASSGSWYYIRQDGSRATGWLVANNAWFYLNSSGIMLKGWQPIGGAWYYLNPSTGVMAKGWTSIGGVWYYLNSSGAMQTGWIQDGGAWYYLDASGAMQTGWLSLGGYWYYLNASGVMQTGWVAVGGYWYYMSANGTMNTGWLQLGGPWYYLSPGGAMVTGRYPINGHYYLFDSGGVWIG